MKIRILLLISILGGIINFHLYAQDRKISLKDTLDHQFDLSDYVINMHGFVPVPFIISEPALGNFGGALALVFMTPKKSMGANEQFRFPDITGGAGMYTLNNSWGGGLLRQGSVPKIGMRYLAAVGYCDVNLDFYREVQETGQFKNSFNLKPLFILADVSENLFRNRIFAGMRYQFSYTGVDAELSHEVIDSIFDYNMSDNTLGMLGLYAELDYRNSMFTPDKGIRFRAMYYFARSYFGSDFDVDRLEVIANAFFQPYRWWVCGLRAEGYAVGEDAPFYFLPYIIMRGIPMMKYQGQEVIMFETEQRFDVTRRWSLLGFVGTGKTFSDSELLQDDRWYVAGGAGFRYLLARLFRLRMGVDVAMGPDNQFAYYIVFGHNWNR